MAAKKEAKTDLSVASRGLGALVQDGTWDFATIFNTPLKNLSTEQKTLAWLLVDVMEGTTEERKAEIRLELLEEAKTNGTIEGEKRHYVLNVEGNEVKAQRSTPTKPDEKKLKALLEKKELQKQECFDEVVTLVFNPSKFESMVDRGILTETEKATLYEDTFSLKIKANKEVEKDLDLIKSRLGRLKPAKPAKALK